MLFRSLGVSIILAFLAGCGAAATTPSVPITAALNATIIPLGSGTAAVPAGAFCVGIANIPQAAGGNITHAHVAGFMYVLSGVHTLQVAGSADTTTNPGGAAFIGDLITHTHANLQSFPNSWDFIGVRPAGKCSTAPPVPGAAVVYASPDEPALAPRSYTEILSEIDLAAGGRTAQHTGATQVFLVLSGSVNFILNGQATTLGVNQGFIEPADTTAQESDAGSGSRLLAFVVQ